jgi:cobalt-zinc-cadmium efflux system protein
MAHDHAHHAPRSPTRAFGLGIAINLAYVAVEAGVGLAVGSLALVADAGHNLGDVLALAVSWAAAVLATTPPSSRRTYGWRRATILGALFSAGLLLMALGVLAWEALGRIAEPSLPEPGPVMLVAGIGVLVNGATALLFARGRERDLNLRAAFTHMAADTAVSVGVVLAGAGMAITGWAWLDPAMSLVVVVVCVVGTWSLFRESADLAVDAVPRRIDPEAVRRYLAERPGVAAVHDLHIWAMSTTDVALTAHLVVPGGGLDDRGLSRLAHDLEARFGIGHTTVQVERGDDEAGCGLAGTSCV